MTVMSEESAARSDGHRPQVSTRSTNGKHCLSFSFCKLFIDFTHSIADSTASKQVDLYSNKQSPAIASTSSSVRAPRQTPFTLEATDDSKCGSHI